MRDERFLVTGALGCIGAWVATLLVREGVPVVAYDLGGDDHRLQLIASPAEIGAIAFVGGDVTDLGQIEHTLADHRITHVVHLAALQVPFVKADPPLGARVNVVGTVNVFEAARRHGLTTPIAYASTAAVYDDRGDRSPRTLYGVFKNANEGTAAVYWADEGMASLGIRPFVVFGPGRDQGLTSGPTLAMVAAARGEPYRIAFGGRTELHYAPDVARGFIGAARAEATGAFAYDFPGVSTHLSEVVSAIEAAAPDAAGLITFDDVPLPFPDELPGERLAAAVTPLDTAVRDTIELFRAAGRTA
ncbi:MAG TPA: NAD(P)-dependent oxidoreductase [Gaiellaceae bacterium]|nr:NAD(P)-dependent oxidoreductase [Gaiellaceae bacterium]